MPKKCDKDYRHCAYYSNGICFYDKEGICAFSCGGAGVNSGGGRGIGLPVRKSLAGEKEGWKDA